MGLEQLIAEPDNFDAWSGPIRDRISGKEITREDRITIAWLITEMVMRILKYLLSKQNLYPFLLGIDQGSE